MWEGHSVHSSPGLAGTYGADLSHLGSIYPGWDYGNMFAHPIGEVFPPAGMDGNGAGSKSPASATSSAPHPLWSQQYDNAHGRSQTFSPTGTETSGPDFDPAINYYEAQDHREDAIITTELGNILSPQDTFGFQPHLASLDRRYLDAYWLYFDPVFSVMNRFTFEASDTAPLVKALMIAIGAYHLGDHAAQTLSRTLRETCSKLLHEVSPEQ